MTDFTEIDLEREIGDLDGDEARETLREFMATHEDNIEAYDETVAEFREEVADLEDEIDGLEERVSAFKQEKAEAAAEYAKLPADLLVDRFSIEELEQIVEEAEEFSEDSTDEPDEDDDNRLTTFSDKEERGKRETEDRPSEYREKASTLMARKGIPVDNE